MSTSVTYLNRTPMYLASMLWCASKNKYQKDVCFQDIGLHAHNEMIVVSSVWVDVTWRKGGGLYDHFNKHENLHCGDE